MLGPAPTNVLLSACLIGGAMVGVVAHAADAINVSANDGYVTDEAHILTPIQEDDLERSLADYDRKTSNQIAVLVLLDASGAVLSDLGVAVMERWGIGQREKDNGILLLVDYANRRVWITTGYGLEGAVPDIVAKGIIEKDMVPAFRSGEYAEGIATAVASLQKHVEGEYTADRYSATSLENLVPWIVFIGFLFVNFFGAYLARTTSWWLGGALGGGLGGILTYAFGWWLSIPFFILLGLLFDYVVSAIGPTRLRGRFRPSGDWSTRRGGGFRGFGGGSSGGGGAGGQW